MSDELIQQLQAGLRSESAQATETIGLRLAGLLPPDSVLALHGSLGVGKTTLVRGLARAWGIHEPVKSPTFNIYSVYKGERQLVHLDAYRLGDASELDALMIDDFLQSPWCFAVEWPERIAEALPENTWHLDLSIEEDAAHHIVLRHSSR